MEGAQAAQCFGGAAENWTADQRYFIDYTYDIALNGKEVKVHATCDSAQIVNALSIQLTDGTAVVEEAEALAWVADITAHAGNTPVYDDTTSEAGSIIWTWRLDDKTLTLYKTGDVMSLSIVPAQEAAQ